MGLVIVRANEALSSNPGPNAPQYLTTHGSDWLWAVTAVYLLEFFVFFALTFAARHGEKIFHYLFTIALLIGTITYFSLASNLGWLLISQANSTWHGATRQILWAKYVNWVVQWPVWIIALGLLSGVSWATIAYNVFLAWTWAISYLVGSFTASNYKWGFYAFGTLAWILLAFNTLFHGSRVAGRVGVSRDFTILAGWLNFVWLLYPIAWGVADGGNRIGVDGSFIFYGILDLLTTPLLAPLVLVLARHWDYGKLNLEFTRYGRVRSLEGTFPEKGHTAPAGGPVGTTAPVGEHAA